MDLSSNQDPSSQPTDAVQNGALPPAKPPATSPGSTDPSLNPRLRTLIAKEREIFQRRQGFKEVESAAEKYTRLQKLAQEDPESALSELGLDYDKVTEARLLDPEAKARRQLESQIQALQKRLDERDNKDTETRSATEAQEARGEIDALITGSDDFELCAAYGDHDLILATQKLHEEKTKTKATFEEVARWVEAERESQLDRIKETKKAKARWGQPAVDPAGQAAAREVIAEAKPAFTSTPVPRPGESRTLSNDLTGGAVPQSPATSIADLRRRALEELKKVY
jgi:hypothetical protein